MKHKKEWVTCDVCSREIDENCDTDKPVVEAYFQDMTVRRYSESGGMTLEHFCNSCKQTILQALTQCGWKYENQEKSIWE